MLLTYPGGAVAKVESGYIQPGRWQDPVVPGAMTTKEVVVVGETATADVDLEAGRFTWWDIHHELRQGVWTPIIGAKQEPPLEPTDPLRLIGAELEAFLAAARARRPAVAGALECGVQVAAVLEAAYESARRGAPVKIELDAAVGAR